MAEVSRNSLERSVWFCFLVAFCASLAFCYKVDACGMGPGCHETMKRVEGMNPNCDVGGTIEVLPNGYVACHCPKETSKP